jgi:hypothetical protein
VILFRAIDYISTGLPSDFFVVLRHGLLPPNLVASPMGLGGRKVKQRIGNDPRNLSWADGEPISFSLVFSLGQIILNSSLLPCLCH